jgi:hypothetical protein
VHPWTCTYVRLLGPCFKTGQMEPFRHHTVSGMHSITPKTQKPMPRQSPCVKLNTATRHSESSSPMSATRHIRQPRGKQPCPWSFPQLWTDVDTQGKKHHINQVVKLTKAITFNQQAITFTHNNLAKNYWFHSLPFQQFQARLTLFPKSFSPFPHGTCLLSVSNQYLASDEIYHQICAPVPRNVTLRRNTVHEGLQMTNGTLTLIDALFQEAYICAYIGNASWYYNSRPQAPISILSLSLFIRHYW